MSSVIAVCIQVEWQNVFWIDMGEFPYNVVDTVVWLAEICKHHGSWGDRKIYIKVSFQPNNGPTNLFLILLFLENTNRVKSIMVPSRLLYSNVSVVRRGQYK